MNKELGFAISKQLRKLLLATTDSVTRVRSNIEDCADKYAKKGDATTANELRTLSEKLDKAMNTFSDGIIGQMFSGKGDTGEFSVLNYVQSEYSDAFRKFCQKNALQVDEQAANRYLDLILKEEEDAHSDGLD